ncbi:MAG: AGE family epimerase/isomerase [Bacteroidetes bacterium]|nr:AGE family epimerase/isomerase [Bacteroidota bacterium]
MHDKGKDNAELVRFYKDQIQNNFFRFWNNAVDRKNGGIFNCFNNAGTTLVSRNKYTWSQGRFVWVWSKLYELSEGRVLSLDMNKLKEDLERTVRFLEKHVFMQNGNCVFLTDETGNWIESNPGKGFDTSFYADCFIALGFSAYAKVFEDRHYAELALRTYRQIDKRVKQNSLRSEPYPIPKGYKFHSVPMIMLNVTEELALTLEKLGDERGEEVDRDSCYYMKEIMEVFYNDKEGRVIETIGPEGVILNNVLCRHVNPGHAIEDMWFVMDLAGRKNRVDYIDKAARGVKSAIRMGWDNEFGGLLRFADVDGGKPKGERTGDLYETLILDTWDTKLWWPHSEMLYTTLLSYSLTRDEEFIALYNMAHEYAFNTFPDDDNKTGEWVQIRDRGGNPINKVVALPVKDPYHILRNMILILELLKQKQLI